MQSPKPETESEYMRLFRVTLSIVTANTRVSFTPCLARHTSHVMSRSSFSILLLLMQVSNRLIIITINRICNVIEMVNVLKYTIFAISY